MWMRGGLRTAPTLTQHDQTGAELECDEPAAVSFKLRDFPKADLNGSVMVMTRHAQSGTPKAEPQPALIVSLTGNQGRLVFGEKSYAGSTHSSISTAARQSDSSRMAGASTSE